MQRIVDSQAMQLLITLVTYAFYALILGLSFTPAAALVIWAWQAIVQPMGSISFSPVLLFGLCLGAGRLCVPDFSSPRHERFHKAHESGDTARPLSQSPSDYPPLADLRRHLHAGV